MFCCPAVISSWVSLTPAVISAGKRVRVFQFDDATQLAIVFAVAQLILSGTQTSAGMNDKRPTSTFDVYDKDGWSRNVPTALRFRVRHPKSRRTQLRGSDRCEKRNVYLPREGHDGEELAPGDSFVVQHTVPAALRGQRMRKFTCSEYYTLSFVSQVLCSAP